MKVETSSKIIQECQKQNADVSTSISHETITSSYDSSSDSLNSIDVGTLTGSVTGKITEEPSSESLTNGGATGKNAKIVWQFLRKHGYSATSAAAIIGNWQHESGMLPGNENKAEKYGSLGPDECGIGFAQWTFGRHINLVNYAKLHGKSWYSIPIQMNFFILEAKSTRTSGSANNLNSYKSLESATSYFFNHFEGINDGSFASRYSAAKEAYSAFKTIDDDSPIDDISNDATEDSTESNRLLAAYSVALDNLTIKVTVHRKFTSGKEGKWINTYTAKDNQGNNVPIYQTGEKEGQIDYEKDLTTRLQKYVNGGGTFYDLSFDQENGNTKVYTEKQEVASTKTDNKDQTKTDNTGTNNPQDNKTYKTTRYIVPNIEEKDLNDTAEDLFNIKTSATYKPSKDGTADSYEGATNGTVINSIAQNTSALLYDEDGSGENTDNTSFDMNGSLKWPVKSKVITEYFGAQRSYERHPGIDIATSTGSSVWAAAAGTVEVAGWYGGYGKCVVINHGHGIKTIYGHNSELKVHVGQKVFKGQLISLSGSTGFSTGPHLHFELRINDTAVNPLPYVNGSKHF